VQGLCDTGDPTGGFSGLARVVARCTCTSLQHRAAAVTVLKPVWLQSSSSGRPLASLPSRGFFALERLAGFSGNAVARRIAVFVSARRVVDDELNHHRDRHRQRECMAVARGIPGAQ